MDPKLNLLNTFAPFTPEDIREVRSNFVKEEKTFKAAYLETLRRRTDSYWTSTTTPLIYSYETIYGKELKHLVWCLRANVSLKDLPDHTEGRIVVMQARLRVHADGAQAFLQERFSSVLMASCDPRSHPYARSWYSDEVRTFIRKWSQASVLKGKPFMKDEIDDFPFGSAAYETRLMVWAHAARISLQDVRGSRPQRIRSLHASLRRALRFDRHTVPTSASVLQALERIKSASASPGATTVTTEARGSRSPPDVDDDAKGASASSSKRERPQDDTKEAKEDKPPTPKRHAPAKNPHHYELRITSSQYNAALHITVPLEAMAPMDAIIHQRDAPAFALVSPSVVYGDLSLSGPMPTPRLVLSHRDTCVHLPLRAPPPSLALYHSLRAIIPHARFSIS